MLQIPLLIWRGLLDIVICVEARFKPFVVPRLAKCGVGGQVRIEGESFSSVEEEEAIRVKPSRDNNPAPPLYLLFTCNVQTRRI